MSIKAIETQYKGYRFRSRLEARWAVFFDALGVRWEYEKEGFELGDGIRYLPDFWLPDMDLWIEVKGQEPTDDELIKLIYLQDATGHSAFVFKQIPSSVDDRSYYRDTVTSCDEPRWSKSIPFEGKSPILAKDASADGRPGEYHIVCPLCHGEHVHFLTPTLKDSDDYTAWEGRGSAAFIPMFCEAGHNWTLRFGFHKGHTFMTIEGMSEQVSNPGLAFALGDYAKFDLALTAAHSARFEHGESPRIA